MGSRDAFLYPWNLCFALLLSWTIQVQELCDDLHPSPSLLLSYNERKELWCPESRGEDHLLKIFQNPIEKNEIYRPNADAGIELRHFHLWDLFKRAKKWPEKCSVLVFRMTHDHILFPALDVINSSQKARQILKRNRMNKMLTCCNLCSVGFVCRCKTCFLP